MHDIDFERAAVLMDIQQKVANISPQNSYILGEASEELKEINELCRQNAEERAAEVRAQMEEAHNAEQARLREEQGNALDSDNDGIADEDELDGDVDDDDKAPVVVGRRT